MQNSYQQTPYKGTEAYQPVYPEAPRDQTSELSGSEMEKAAPANFHPSPNKGSIYLPIVKRRVGRKPFWIVVGVVGGLILIAIIVGVAVGVTNANKNKSVGPSNGGNRGGNPQNNVNNGGNSNDRGNSNSNYDNSNTDSNTDSNNFDNSNTDTSTDSNNFDNSNTDTNTNTDTSDSAPYDNSGSDSTSSSTDPCQQLLDAGAPTSAVSDCLYQQHLTTMQIIDNFDGTTDYTYTYTPYNYASTNKQGGKPTKHANHKIANVIKLEKAAKGLSGKPSQFSQKLGGKNAQKPKLTGKVGSNLNSLKAIANSKPEKLSLSAARNSRVKRAIQARSVEFEITPKIKAAHSFLSNSD